MLLILLLQLLLPPFMMDCFTFHLTRYYAVSIALHQTQPIAVRVSITINVQYPRQGLSIYTGVQGTVTSANLLIADYTEFITTCDEPNDHCLACLLVPHTFMSTAVGWDNHTKA